MAKSGSTRRKTLVKVLPHKNSIPLTDNRQPRKKTARLATPVTPAQHAKQDASVDDDRDDYTLANLREAYARFLPECNGVPFKVRLSTGEHGVSPVILAQASVQLGRTVYAGLKKGQKFCTMDCGNIPNEIMLMVFAFAHLNEIKNVQEHAEELLKAADQLEMPALKRYVLSKNLQLNYMELIIIAAKNNESTLDPALERYLLQNVKRCDFFDALSKVRSLSNISSKIIGRVFELVFGVNKQKQQ